MEIPKRGKEKKKKLQLPWLEFVYVFFFPHTQRKKCRVYQNYTQTPRTVSFPHRFDLGLCAPVCVRMFDVCALMCLYCSCLSYARRKKKEKETPLSLKKLTIAMKPEHTDEDNVRSREQKKKKGERREKLAGKLYQFECSAARDELI